VSDIRDILAANGRVVTLEQVRKGAVMVVARVADSAVEVAQSGVFDQNAVELPRINKGAYTGPLPTATYHGATISRDVFPDAFGLVGQAPRSTFFILSSIAPLSDGPKVTYVDARPDSQRKAYPLPL
jgi:hypothetical protein